MYVLVLICGLILVVLAPIDYSLDSGYFWFSMIMGIPMLVANPIVYVVVQNIVRKFSHKSSEDRKALPVVATDSCDQKFTNKEIGQNQQAIASNTTPTSSSGARHVAVR